MSDHETIAHLRGVNARLTADVRDIQEQADAARDEAARYRAALAEIAAFPIDAHTCRDHVMRDVARRALGQ